MILLDNTQIILSTIFTQYNYSDNRDELFSEDTVLREQLGVLVPEFLGGRRAARAGR